jgi:hypothetical protein
MNDADNQNGIVILTTEAIDGEAAQIVIDEIRRGSTNGDPEVHVVCPALAESGLKQTLGDIDGAIEPARERLDATLETLREAGVNASGDVGDSDPVVAIGDQLRQHPARRIVVVAHAERDEQAHAEKELLSRIDGEFEQPATELLVRGHGEDERVTDRAAASPGAKRAEEGHRFSRNLPPFRKQDLLGIAIALIGTIVLIILAANCPDRNEEQGGPLMTIAGGCAIRYLLAGGFFLINLGHVGALLLMESVGYRGPFERFFARLSLIGTPLAIIGSAFAG